MELSDYIVYKELGLIEYLDEEMEKNIENNKEKDEYKELGNIIENYGDIFIKKIDYSEKIKKIVFELSERIERKESFIKKIENLKYDIMRIEEVSKYMESKISLTYKYAAATNKILLYPFENFIKYDYVVKIKKYENEICINIEKENQKYNGKAFFVLNINGEEHKINFEIKDGKKIFNLKNTDEIIYNEEVNIFLGIL